MLLIVLFSGYGLYYVVFDGLYYALLLRLFGSYRFGWVTW